jgi:hypothetical protein
LAKLGASEARFSSIQFNLVQDWDRDADIGLEVEKAMDREPRVRRIPRKIRFDSIQFK